MAWTRVQTTGNTTNTATLSGVAAGNLLVAFCSFHTGPVTSVSDGLNANWTLGTEYSNVSGSSKHYLWAWFLNSAAGSSVCVFNGAASGWWIQMAEYHSDIGSNYIQSPGSEANFIGSSVTTIGGSLGGTVQPGSLALAGSTSNNEAQTYTAGTGMTTVVGTAGLAGGSEVVAMGENLSCGLAPQIKFGCTSDNVGATVLGFTELPVLGSQGWGMVY